MATPIVETDASSAVMATHSIEEVLADIRAGKMVVMMDDQERENEGDLVMTAQLVRPQDINFMARYGRGLICLTLNRERCGQLRLPLMVSDTDIQHATNFTVSIEAAEGVTTGISAYDRAHTIRTAVRPDAVPTDLCQPGHIFPLMAQPGGVLTRAGHTEAGCDLTRLAGLEPAAAIVEILNEDGTMARRDDLQRFAEQHQLKISTIAELIRYRLETENSVERISYRTVPTEFGEFLMHCYEDHVNNTVHLALQRGDIESERPTLVRVHVQNTLSDALSVQWQGLGWPLRSAMQRISEEGQGVVVVLRHHERPRELIEIIDSGTSQKSGSDGATVLRTYGIGAQILRDLGVRRMRVLSAPKQMYGISGFGLEVVEYID